jgi:DNA-directed RNA polymerase specialized sigma24 family protein
MCEVKNTKWANDDFVSNALSILLKLPYTANFDLKDAMNILNVSLQHSILTLAAHGWSRRRIARELDLDRETVGRYLRLVRSKPAISTPGSEADRRQNQPF